MTSFSERHGYQAAEKPIVYREDASANLRTLVIDLAEEHGLRPSAIRSVLCSFLMVAPDPSNWSEYPNVDSECRTLIHTCEWFEVYDIIEKLGMAIYTMNPDKAMEFQKSINRLFVRDGAGWQMENGWIVVRGSEPFNNIIREARPVLQASPYQTAASEIHEAIQDISRRPQPDKSGAVHHAMAAVECITRYISGDAKSTLGGIIKSKAKQHGIPAPLDDAIEKMWGYSSERGRHLREGHEPSFEEAELAVTVAAAVCVYLARKFP